MKRWALIVGSEIASVVEEDGMPDVPGHWEDITGQAVGPGCTKQGPSWSPARGHAHTVSMYQARMALLNAGKLADAESAIAGITGQQGAAARLAWEFKPEVSRDGQLLNAVAAQLGLSADEVDALFVEASAIR